MSLAFPYSMAIILIFYTFLVNGNYMQDLMLMLSLILRRHAKFESTWPYETSYAEL